MLESKVIKDVTDTDMSSALIFATEGGTGTAGKSVKIAAAWGQNLADVDLTWDDQNRSLDLGTVVIPFPSIKVSKTVELLHDNNADGEISPGDDLMYRIRVSNVGQVDIGPGVNTIVDDALDKQLTYRDASTSAAQT
jgi:uncharacterized repeat protein (TIGR01451 family)